MHLVTLAFDDAAALDDAIARLAESDLELLPLATCRRFELVALSRDGAVPAAGGRRLAADGAAAERLFALAAGALSAVPAERAIAEQLDAALRDANRLGLAGPVLTRLVRCALHAAAGVRRTVERTAPILELADLAIAPILERRAATGAAPCIVVLGAGRLAAAVTGRLEAAGLAVARRGTRRPAVHGRGAVSIRRALADLPDGAAVIGMLSGAPGAVAADALPPDTVTIDLAAPGNIESATWTIETLITAFAARLAPQRDAMDVACRRLRRSAQETWRELANPSLAAAAQAIGAYRRSVAESEIDRLAPLLASLDPALRDRLERSIRHTAARCTHVLHEFARTLRDADGASGLVAHLADRTVDAG